MLGTVKIENKQIESVEKGNIDSATSGKKVVAFTVEQNGHKVKLLLKDDKAKLVWDKFLRSGKTIPAVTNVGNLTLNKNVLVSYEADIREIRDKEIVLENPKDLIFVFGYMVGNE